MGATRVDARDPRWIVWRFAWLELTRWFFGLIGRTEMSELRVLVGNVDPFELGIDLEKPGDNRPGQALLDQAADPSNDRSELSGIPIIPKNRFVAAGIGATRVVIHPMLSQGCRVCKLKRS